MGPAAAVAAVGGGLKLFGAFQQAKGAVAQGQAAAQLGNFRAGILRNNAFLSRVQAGDAISRGKTLRERNARQTKQIMGRQRAVLAANGIAVNEGSAADIQADTAFIGAEQDADIKMNAEREALGFRIQASNAEADALVAQFTGERQLKAARSSVLPTLLTAVGNTALGSSSFIK